jgi:hypothetical protein
MSDLDQLVQAWDELASEEDYLKERKDQLRDKLENAYNEHIADEMPHEDHPENIPYRYLASNGLEYKKVVVVPMVVDIEGLRRDHVDIADAVIEKEVKYKFSERKAMKLARKNIEAYRILQNYVKEGNPSVRLYKGTEPKEDDDIDRD